MQKTSQEKFRIKNVKEKVINCMSNGKDMIVVIRPFIKMSQYFPKPFKSFGGNITVIKLIFQIMQQKLILKM